MVHFGVCDGDGKLPSQSSPNFFIFLLEYCVDWGHVIPAFLHLLVVSQLVDHLNDTNGFPLFV